MAQFVPEDAEQLAVGGRYPYPAVPVLAARLHALRRDKPLDERDVLHTEQFGYRLDRAAMR